MRFRRFASGALFVLAVYVFGMYLTAASGGPALTDHLLFVLFGANNRAGIDCLGGNPPLPCNPGVLTNPNGAVEIVDLGTDPPTLRKAIDLGASVPTSLAVAPDGKTFYFVDSLNSNVYFVDSATGAFMNTTFIPQGPIDCVISPDGAFLYVTTQEPSVVTVETTFGTIVDTLAPGQPYSETFGGIALVPQNGDSQLAVGTTSSAPAYYLFNTDDGALALGPRIEVSGYCTDPICPKSDDVAYTNTNTLLLANLACAQLYTFGLPSGQQISGGTFGSEACLPLNPQNSLLFSPLTQLAYLVYRQYSFGIAPGMMIVDPSDFSSQLISSFFAIPEAAAFAPDGRALYIVSQDTFESHPVLNHFDALNGTLTKAIYSFSLLMQNRTAIDAKVVHASGVFTLLAAGIPLVGAKSLPVAAAQLALLLFGFALWRLDRRRR